jgi:hypothetical protein
LLDEVGQFMSQQPPSGQNFWGEEVSTQDHILPGGKGSGMNALRNSVGSVIGVHPHAPQIIFQDLFWLNFSRFKPNLLNPQTTYSVSTSNKFSVLPDFTFRHASLQ